MKVLHILYSGLGGHSNVFFSMVDADAQHVFEFEALFNGVENVRDEYVKRCREKNITWNYVKKRPGLDLGYYLKLYRHIKKSGAAILFLHGGTAAIPVRLANLTSRKKKKIIIRETQANHLKKTVDWFNLANAMLVADTMVYLSEAYKEQVKDKLGFLFSGKRTAIIPNGIDLAIFSKTPAVGIKKPVILGMQSRLIQIKDHISLLHAFALLLKREPGRQLVLRIAGDGEYKEKLLALSATLNITEHVFFTGVLVEEELVGFLHEVDIYIHASLGETMSTAIMQAMACGKPIIASDVPGINNMITDNYTGILVPVKNAEALADAVFELIENPDKAKILGDQAFRFAQENYSNKIMLERYAIIFNQ